ncbi:amidohydrolase family protein [Opitutus terrae]|uniref:Amidohydrolase 2 n=1 Tax=Opitutus terrae (strain DSM 11246 / JCM 15787 / PB90-1) TaxID=452637 RepID=B1ZS32_OPITP|nr:amidohydrolase family protein [Opitutus terrae]ACB74708.1 amidohydrolase 2 [Opitutus terrae PB90-1]
MQIDAHQHFWRYRAADYGWIDDSLQAIRRDFLPADLAPHLSTVGLDGSVAVQARQSLAETEWLLQLAAAHPLVKGVVGWLPLADEGARIGALLDRFAANPRFKGLRHVLQAEPDGYFADAKFNEALEEVSARGLTYDLLIFARQLPTAVAWADRHPSLRIVLDHIAKPVVQGAPPREWREQLRELARRERICCKFSGVVTEVPGWHWTPELLRPYFDVALETFGPRRLMFGSDWPVCLVAADYARWFAFVDDCVRTLSADERAAVLGGTATAFYRLADQS